MNEYPPWLFLLLIFLGHNLGILAALWMYDDARKRYFRKFWAIAWAVCIYPIPLIIFVLYRMCRPPAFIEDAERLSMKTKLVIYLLSYLAAILLVILSAGIVDIVSFVYWLHGS